MNIEQESLLFFHELKEIYFIKRDMAALLQCMESDAIVMGTGEAEISSDFHGIQSNLFEEVVEYSGSFKLLKEEMKTSVLSKELCLVYGRIIAIPEDDMLSKLILNISLICRKTDKGMKLVHCNFSRPDVEQEEGKYYVPNVTREKSNVLQHKLHSREKQLENLMRHIPGALHQCANDTNFTLKEVSDSFLTMFGYSREEIKQLFQDRFLNMIYQEDRSRVKEQVYEQLKKGSYFELEYRVLCKNGELIWILEKARILQSGVHEYCIYGMLIEIQERKKEQEKLRLSLECHKVIMDQTSDIIFEWDIQTDTLTVSSNWKKRFGYSPLKEQVSDRIYHSQNIHPDDIPVFTDIIKRIAEGIALYECEIRIRNVDNQYVWCRIRSTTQFDAKNNPIKAIGVVIDISAEKKERQELLDMAQRDALTGLYNKNAIKKKVEKHLNNNNNKYTHALLIIDVDNFKSVNDQFGHLCGDTLLSDIANVIKSNFRVSDLLARIGGDEFLVFLPNIVDQGAAEIKAQKILTELDKIRPAKESYPITCSIGGMLSTEEISDYYSMYKCADQALYHQKKCGKNGVVFYAPELVAQDSVEEQLESAVGSAIVSDDVNGTEEKLAQYTFQMLYEAVDMHKCINQLLEIIGRSFDVSRVYIFENQDGDARCDNTFEWCAAGVKSEMKHLKDLSYQDDLYNYLDNFGENGVFFCRDIKELKQPIYEVLAPQGICSLLQCTIIDAGKLKGFVGFDECRENRYWTRQQINTLSLISNVLAVFLTKLRLEERISIFTDKPQT